MLRASDQINKIITIEAIMVIKKEFMVSFKTVASSQTRKATKQNEQYFKYAMFGHCCE